MTGEGTKYVDLCQCCMEARDSKMRAKVAAEQQTKETARHGFSDDLADPPFTFDDLVAWLRGSAFPGKRLDPQDGLTAVRALLAAGVAEESREEKRSFGRRSATKVGWSIQHVWPPSYSSHSAHGYTIRLMPNGTIVKDTGSSMERLGATRVTPRELLRIRAAAWGRV